MKIGHVNLAKTFNGNAAQFVGLVEALDRQGIAQHVIVSNRSLARKTNRCLRQCCSRSGDWIVDTRVLPDAHCRYGACAQ